MAQLRTLRETQSLDSIWEELVYTEARLAGDALTRDLVPIFTALLDRWDGVSAAQRAVWREEIRAQAGVDAANAGLDRSTGRLSARFLGVIDGKRTNPRYARYFPHGAYAVQKLALESQLKVVRAWSASLKKEPEAEVQSFAPTFEKHVEEGDAAVRARVDAAAKRTDQRVREIVTFIDDVNAARLRVLGRLLQRAEKNKLDQDWAEDFFRHGSRQVRAEAAEEDPDPAGGGGGQGG